MRILFVHQNCPGQFKHLAPRLASDPGIEVAFLTQPNKPAVEGVQKIEYKPAREVASTTHRYLRLTEEGVLNGQAAGSAALDMKKQGFYPDVIVAHMGWGEALYIKEVFPRARLLGYFEWFYHANGADVGFDPDDPPSLDTRCRINTRNALHLLNLSVADWGVTPTHWQRRQHPGEFRQKLAVVHDGIDTDRVRPNPKVTGTLPNGIQLRAGDEVITYVARNLEPYRGFPTFMRAAELLLERRPSCHILVVGGDGVSYGSAPRDGRTHREHMLEQVNLDRDRIHFLGKLPYEAYLRVLQLSSAHVYLTFPFVLSWSMLEAMSAGCLVIGSRTQPVEEVISHGHNGLLVDFFSPQEVADQVIGALERPAKMQNLRNAARQTIVQRYNLELCLRKQVKLIEWLATGGKAPSPAGTSIGRRRLLRPKPYPMPAPRSSRTRKARA
jgi:glycosyltransferase involved in cell wall biosynthesis